MIEDTTRNLLDAEVEALVNPVNCVGVMGKGLALQHAHADRLALFWCEDQPSPVHRSESRDQYLRVERENLQPHRGKERHDQRCICVHASQEVLQSCG